MVLTNKNTCLLLSKGQVQIKDKTASTNEILQALSETSSTICSYLALIKASSTLEGVGLG